MPQSRRNRSHRHTGARFETMSEREHKKARVHAAPAFAWTRANERTVQGPRLDAVRGYSCDSLTASCGVLFSAGAS
jgi:hypothetical protein